MMRSGAQPSPGLIATLSWLGTTSAAAAGAKSDEPASAALDGLLIAREQSPRRERAGRRHGDRAGGALHQDRARKQAARALGRVRRGRPGLYPAAHPALRDAGRGGPRALEANAERILAEIGFEIRGDDAGAGAVRARPAPRSRASGVHFEPGLLRAISRARRRASSCSTRAIPARTVVIGGDAMVFAPAYGSPFVRDLERGPPLRLARGLPRTS